MTKQLILLGVASQFWHRNRDSQSCLVFVGRSTSVQLKTLLAKLCEAFKSNMNTHWQRKMKRYAFQKLVILRYTYVLASRDDVQKTWGVLLHEAHSANACQVKPGRSYISCS